MIKDIQDKILKKYNRPEEYLTNHYPPNYFDFFIDIGSRGITNPWHLNFIAKNNPDTLCLGYEPDLPYYKELVEKVRDDDLTNVKVHSEAFGIGNSINIPGEQIPPCQRCGLNRTPSRLAPTVTVKDIFEKYKLDSQKRWSFKIDCEGGEYALLTDQCGGCVEILKNADHISFEFHTDKAGMNYFTYVNYMMGLLPDTFDVGEKWMEANFSDTHTIFLTSAEKGLRTYVLLTDNILNEKDNLFWKDLL